MLRCLLCLVVASSVVSAASEPAGHVLRPLVDTLVTVGPGRAVVWQPLTGADVAVTVNGSGGGSAADVMLMPLDEWRSWQVTKADAAAEHRLRPGRNVSFSQRGACREQWVLTVAHAWDVDTYPPPQPAIVHVMVTGGLLQLNASMRLICRCGV